MGALANDGSSAENDTENDFKDTSSTTDEDELMLLILNDLKVPKEYQSHWQEDAILLHLEEFTGDNIRSKVNRKETGNNHQDISKAIMVAIQEFSQTERSTEKLAGRKALEEAAQRLLSSTNKGDHDISSLIATMLVVIALALERNSTFSDPIDNRRSISSAIVATITKEYQQGNNDANKEDSKPHEQPRSIVARSLFQALFEQTSTAIDSAYSDDTPKLSSLSVDWHIISGLAKALQINCLYDKDMAQTVAKIISNMLQLEQSTQQQEQMENGDDISIDSSSSAKIVPQVSKTDAAAALALAAQLQPWQALEPKLLVQVAIPYDLWHAAERICTAATTGENAGASYGKEAVEALLEAVFEAKHYRQADAFATEFFHAGGQSRFLEARFLHACGTIVKVIRKGATPIIDRQIDRVEKSAEMLLKDGVDVDYSISMDPKTAGKEIRSFAIRQLEEAGNIEAARRLADLWSMEYIFDEKALLEAERKRRETYLQWDDVLPGSPPDLISTPEVLLAAMERFRQDESKSSFARKTIYGFDVEWNEDDAGADLLQIANKNQVLLIDIPALSESPEGVEALKQTVGDMFASSTCTLVGFSCNQDISKLRSSPTCYKKEKRKKHWFDPIHGVSDLQTIIMKRDRSLGKLGLSRVCEKYLGKPLDKAEQCSFWDARPLSLRQRTYAALDAWTIVGILEKLSS